jgi:hypothetical protein
LETIDLIGSTMGLGFVAGIRLYATVFALGLAIRLGWLQLGGVGEPLRILAHPAVLIVAGVACLIEFFADKVPWLDSAWDSFHAFIRPIGAVVVAAAAFGTFNPVLKVTLILLCGGMAFASHSSKAATRLLVNHSPEPFSNIGISLAEDALVPLGIWLSLRHPAVTLGLALLFLAVFAWIMPRIFRAVRLQLAAVGAMLRGGERPGQGVQGERALTALKPDAAAALGVVDLHAKPIPAKQAGIVRRALGEETPALGIRAAATKSIKGLGNSIGYLVAGEDGLAFVAKRGLLYRVHRIPFADTERIEWKRGLLMNRLVVHTAQGEHAFYVFKDVDIASAGAPAQEEASAEKA